MDFTSRANVHLVANALAMVKYCPITGNQAHTTMTSMETAERLCHGHQAKAEKKHRVTWCRKCQGKHLTEYVHIVPLETLVAKENIMALREVRP